MFKSHYTRKQAGVIYRNVKEGKLEMSNAGNFKTAVRMFSKNANLPHRQDFCYVKWFEIPAFC